MRDGICVRDLCWWVRAVTRRNGRPANKNASHSKFNSNVDLVFCECDRNSRKQSTSGKPECAQTNSMRKSCVDRTPNYLVQVEYLHCNLFLFLFTIVGATWPHCPHVLPANHKNSSGKTISDICTCVHTILFGQNHRQKCAKMNEILHAKIHQINCMESTCGRTDKFTRKESVKEVASVCACVRNMLSIRLGVISADCSSASTSACPAK